MPNYRLTLTFKGQKRKKENTYCKFKNFSPKNKFLIFNEMFELKIQSELCFNFIYLFIYGCTGSSFATHGLSLVVASRGHSSLQCTGFSLRWLPCHRPRALGAWASGVAACRLRLLGLAAPWRVGSYGTRDRTMSSALAGRFLTIEPPPGKS